MKKLIKSLLQHTPYRLIRARDENRFLAIEETLRSLRGRGYKPRRIIDGGANVGAFSRTAASCFPDALIHLIEPQPACISDLRNLAQAPNVTLHQVAIGRNSGRLQLAIDPAGITTGAHIVPTADYLSDAIAEIAVETLDSLLGGDIEVSDRTLLKLDLQGWELEALEGAKASLPKIEVILIEVSFFAQANEPSIETLMSFLCEHGFALHDIAALASRQRDNRAHQGDFLFVHCDSALMADRAWH